LALCALVAAFLGAAPQALAFFPFGGTSGVSLELRFYRWSIEDMDTNGDGDVSGPNEGIPITIERGDFGFTAEEEIIVEESFEVWEDVTTSFAAFQYTAPIVDPAGIFTANTVQDGLNLVALQVPGDPITAGAGFPILGQAFIMFFLEDDFMSTSDGTLFEVQGARTLEADIVIDAVSHRGTPAAFDLLATMVHEVGHIMGIGHNPMSSLTADPTLNETVETAVYAQRDANGILQRVGVTPTMFPSAFLTDDGTGNLYGGGLDLAPDDRGAISFLYPRTNQSDFFAIFGEARTQSRAQIPSSPVLGSLVTAWADVDNNPSTPRVPFLSTMTGLYTPSNQLSNRGQIVMPALLKEFVGFGDEAPFQATYTFTMAPINPFNQLAGGNGPAAFDSTHLPPPLGDGTPWTVPYDVFVQTETFFAGGELFGQDNVEGGTVLAWDPLRNTIVEPTTGRSFASMVANDTPMFGDKSEVCPLLVIEQEFAVVVGPNLLRGFRDKMLLQTAVGVAVVDAYYQAGPALARLLREKPLLLKIAGATAVTVEWLLLHGSAAPLALALALVLSALFIRRRRRAVATATAIAIMGFALLMAPAAHALIAPISEGELIALAENVIEGTVTRVTSELTDSQNRVVTTVEITVSDTMKGSLNKQSTIYFDLPYGRVGNFVVMASEMPNYTEGEVVILFLRSDGTGALIPLGGNRGKHKVAVDPEDGKRYVVGDFVSQAHMKQVSKTVRKTKGLDPDAPDVGPDVELDDYKAFVRGEVRKQRKGR
jgi:hypothetical protein